MARMETPITWEAWKNLKPGDGIKDAYGHRWTVTWKDPTRNLDRLYATRPGEQGENRLEWHKHQIVDENREIVRALNNLSVYILSSGK